MYSKENKFKKVLYGKLAVRNVLLASECKLLCGMYIALICDGELWELLSGQYTVRSLTYASYSPASTDGPAPLFYATCDFKQQLPSIPRESAQGKSIQCIGL